MKCDTMSFLWNTLIKCDVWVLYQPKIYVEMYLHCKRNKMTRRCFCTLLSRFYSLIKKSKNFAHQKPNRMLFCWRGTEQSNAITRRIQKNIALSSFKHTEIIVRLKSDSKATKSETTCKWYFIVTQQTIPKWHQINSAHSSSRVGFSLFGSDGICHHMTLMILDTKIKRTQTESFRNAMANQNTCGKNANRNPLVVFWIYHATKTK